MNTLKKTLIAGCAALSMATAMAPTQAEARYGRNAALAAGLIGGALVAGAIATRPAYAAPVYAGPRCYRARDRVWSDYHGRFVIVRRTICD